MVDELIPVKGCWVRPADREQIFGTVIDRQVEHDPPRVKVKWFSDKREEWMSPLQLRCGFKRGMDVLDVPYSRTRQSLGQGVVVEARNLGHRDQVLVDFMETGQKVWLPYQNLRQAKGVRHRFLTGDSGGDGSAERFRLKSLAYALELSNENSGALSHLDIDPLPHQIHLVHHILASGNLNWLIADDVGLGKTIEVGMLLAALRQRNILRRILLVTPAGLTKQWQDELRHKFGMGDFVIYGEDFTVNESHHWKLYDHVIGSIDRFKNEDNLTSLMMAEPWDLIVFDEAHRLSRRQYGMKLDASQRFHLAAMLRKKSDSFLLLSATPHQGFQDKFQALLELLRPEWKRFIKKMEISPEFLKHMVIRNNKADVTDAQGNFIFKGKSTSTIQVNVGPETNAFDRALQKYLRQGYQAGQALGRKGNAIGFVMTIYRKLAASSAAAIYMALLRRRQRLLRGDGVSLDEVDLDAVILDERYQGEYEESFELFGREFFTGELPLLDDLIERAKKILEHDRKLETFLETLLPSLLENETGRKVLIFTEYRSTQDYLSKALANKFGEGTVALIHGSLNHHQRREAIAQFEETGKFLVSTEAGGEGINLQRNCHVMVNYDLPWNPMRLVQRIGRLYRYGQKKKVLVFNVLAAQTLDEQILGLMYERIQQVVRDMATVADEFRDGLEDDILGEVADLIDVQEILQNALEQGVQRSQESINNAIERARTAAEKQRDLFEYVSSFDPSEMSFEMNIGMDHLRAFVEGMFNLLGIEVLGRVHQGAILDIRIPEELAEEIPGVKTRMQVTHDRLWAAQRPHLHMLDLDSSLVRVLLARAKAYEFGGLTARIGAMSGEVVATGVLRWQNDQGRRIRQEFSAFSVEHDGKVVLNKGDFGLWLMNPSPEGSRLIEREACINYFEKLEHAADDRLAKLANRDLHPENKEWVSAGWCGS